MHTQPVSKVSSQQSAVSVTSRSKRHFLTALIASALCLLGSQLLLADSPPDDPARPQNEEHLAPLYQPTDGTVLSRYRFTPPGYHDGATYPVVLMLPPAEFKDADDLGVVSERQATASLAKAGFLVFQIEHRLAYPGLLTPHDNTPGSQPPHTLPVDTSGLPPQQQGDIERQVLAALADPHCNQSIYLVGGSSGGCHALWVALTSTPSDNSGWTASARTHIKAAVSLSGPTDLGNWTDYEVGYVNIGHFIGDGENYTNTKVYPPNDADKKTILTADSPISLVPSATSVPPILMFGTKYDPVPWQQGSNMYDALFARGVMTAAFHQVNEGYDHAFNYWYETDVQDVPQGRSVGNRGSGLPQRSSLVAGLKELKV